MLHTIRGNVLPELSSEDRLFLAPLREQIDAIDHALIDSLSLWDIVLSPELLQSVDIDDKEWWEALVRKVSSISWALDSDRSNKFVRLLAERFQVVRKVWEYKIQRGIPPLQPARWQEVVSDRKSYAQKHGLDTKLIEDIWELFHEYALILEERCHAMSWLTESVNAHIPA